VEKLPHTALPLAALLWLVSFPASAVGGYDIAHIVKRTCEPGGPLIVADQWKRPRDRDRLITEPGEVIACPPAGADNSFQIAAGPERIGREDYLCTYFSLLNGDGGDICSVTDSGDGAQPVVNPLMAIRVDESGRLALSGIASDDVSAVGIAPFAPIAPDATMVEIDRQRAARLGARRAFGYFSLAVDSRTVCAEGPAQLLGRDRSGERIAESVVPMSTRLLDSADRVPYARSLKSLCGSRGPSQPTEVRWLTEIGALFRSLFWLRGPPWSI
jgi:hypothetical protein